MSDYHTSVLLREAIEFLHVVPGQKYIDATLGGGGHTSRILELGGLVLSLDVDQDAINDVKLRITNGEVKHERNLSIVRGNFRNIREIAYANHFERVSGILFDLGVSSYQFDKAEKGFSFQKKGALDMRMDQELGVTAADLVNALTKEELIQVFGKYGEEVHAKRIAGAILEARKKKKIETTDELADIVMRVYPVNHNPQRHETKKIHPATKIFQALRIAVNDELHSIEEALEQAVSLLVPGGRLVVISFHSLEDRIVKNSFITFTNQEKGVILTKKPVEPTYEEIEANRRSRSAKLRAFEKA